MHSSLKAVGLIDILDSDPRPTFVVALRACLDGNNPTPANVVYGNAALANEATLLDSILSAPSDHATFWAWVTRDEGQAPHSFVHRGLWTRSVVQSKWAIVGRNASSVGENDFQAGLNAHDKPQSTPQRNAPSLMPTNRQNNAESVKLSRVTSETRLKLSDLALHQQRFLDVLENTDWATTPLGPMDRWPPLLQQGCSQMLCNSQPTALYWGDKHTTVYNQAFSELVGSLHPSALGKPMHEVFPEMADQIKRLMDISVKKQRASNEDETHFFVKQYDAPPRETYLKWSIVPLIQNNECLGFLHPISETTMNRLFKRRVKMLVNMGEVLGTAKDVKSYWSKVIEEFAECEPSHEIPLAFLYSIQENIRKSPESGSKYGSNRTCHLEGALGVNEGHPIIPRELHLGTSNAGLSQQFRQALQSKKPSIIGTADGSWPQHLLEGIEWRGYGDACNVAVILPIRPTKEEEVMGLLVLGLNPRRPYDDAYKLYIQLLNQKLAACLACTVLLEEECRRGRNAAEQAAYDQAMLKEKLAYQTKETIEYTRLFQTVSEFIPNGFFIGDHQGNITFANNLWYRITGYPEGPLTPDGFLSCVYQEDRHKIRDAYDQLRHTDEVDFEFRIRIKDSELHGQVKSPFDKPDFDLGDIHDERERHVMAQAKAERAGDGTIIRTFTCLTDVTTHRRTAEAALQRAQEAENLKRMAELATVGMFDMDISGRLWGANNVFWELCGIEKVNLQQVELRPWAASIVEEDFPILQESLARLSTEGKPQVAEMRLKTTWIARDTAGNSVETPRWVSATFMPVSDTAGVVQSFTGCLSDVSLPRWQLELETKHKEEAIESKRQQDNFIDMTSHEMRNPLSAIIHCSDAITASLSKSQELVKGHPAMASAIAEHDDAQSARDRALQLISDSIDNAETIVACAQHQKRIVDDILTMSKLDSKLLAVTPCTVNPVQIGQEALKMFDVEARRVDIDLKMRIDKSYTDLGHEYLDLDPSRVKQVLINLLTNALKFTKSGSTRTVSVAMKASLQRPTEQTSSSVSFIPRSCEEEVEYSQPALEGRENPVYLMFEVKDTGQGLTEREKASLFNKFVQASSRTHVKYGGSGLGLFISRRLTELQRGAIGVSSLAGVGSTFAFFIEAYVPSEAARHEAALDAANAAKAAMAVLPQRTRVQSTGGKLQQQVKSEDDFRLDGILIVEDNLINQQITRRGLHDRGFSVDVANHGLEALDKLMSKPGLQNEQSGKSSLDAGSHSQSTMGFNMILMDIEMPVQDGLTCTRQIRALESKGSVFCANGGRIPIIAVSANARSEQVDEARMAGCDDVMVKPFRMPELIEKMQVLARRMGPRVRDSDS